MTGVPYLVRAATPPTTAAGAGLDGRLLDGQVAFDRRSREHPVGGSRHDLTDHLAAFVKQAWAKRWSDSLSSISASVPSTAASPGFAFLGGSSARR